MADVYTTKMVYPVAKHESFTGDVAYHAPCKQVFTNNVVEQGAMLLAML